MHVIRIIRPTMVWCVAVLVLAALSIGPASANQDEGWPREITNPKGKVVIYQPQLETFEGNVLTARAAVSVTLADQSEPVFGAIWITSQVETDRSERTVSIVEVEVTDVRFPEDTEQQKQKLATLLAAEIPKWEMVMSLDRLLAALAATERDSEMALDLDNDPPVILFHTEPAVLVTYDGQPQLHKIEGSNLMRVINTPYPVILETSTKKYFLNGGEIWYRADDPLGPWELEPAPPAGVTALIPAEEDTRASTGEAEESSAAPQIVVATEPTELLVADGEPEFSPISGTDLLFMSNTESDILLEISTQTHFVLLSGRWFSSASLEGPWTYVPADSLPEDFARIPLESANGHLLTFVAGTQQAKEAVMDNQIPQTSAVSRKDNSLQVTYDGEPQFESIAGTEMQYAVNTGHSVLQIDSRYYCCHEAVWYEAAKAAGPWTVSTSLPGSVQDIPPECPVYNVKYVYIYDSTPDVVYVGYTPAYMGSYVYGPCLVYGTGYYYTPWYSPTYYYPRPSSWSFHVRYNPYYGWSYGLSYSSGPFRLTVGFGGSSGWWGPGHHHHYPHRSYHKTNINVNRNINVNTGDINIGNRNRDARSNQANIYNRSNNQARNTTRSTSPDRVQPRVSQDQRNDVFTDRSGNVHRRTYQGWEKRQGRNWSPPQSSKPGGSQDRSKVGQPKQSPQTSQLDRDYSARQRGNDRARQAPSSRGGSRGGRRR